MIFNEIDNKTFSLNGKEYTVKKGVGFSFSKNKGVIHFDFPAKGEWENYSFTANDFLNFISDSYNGDEDLSNIFD